VDVTEDELGLIRMVHAAYAPAVAAFDDAELSAWLGGTCHIDPFVDGRVSFDLPDDGVAATGVVRAFVPPRDDLTVAHIEHTFVDRDAPELAAVCRWAIVRLDEGCDLHLVMVGAGELTLGRFRAVADRLAEDEPAPEPTDEQAARAALQSAEIVLLVDWVGDETPRTIVQVAPIVFGKIGPRPDDWARLFPSDDPPGYRVERGPRPDHVDLLHLDWTLGFDEFFAEAVALGATTFWYHSSRTRPPAPADNRGCWLPPRTSARLRAAVEAAGIAYIVAHNMVDVARSLLAALS
jgi:hypothetical protein